MIKYSIPGNFVSYLNYVYRLYIHVHVHVHVYMYTTVTACTLYMYGHAHQWLNYQAMKTLCPVCISKTKLNLKLTIHACVYTMYMYMYMHLLSTQPPIMHCCEENLTRGVRSSMEASLFPARLRCRRDGHLPRVSRPPVNLLSLNSSCVCVCVCVFVCACVCVYCMYMCTCVCVVHVCL